MDINFKLKEIATNAHGITIDTRSIAPGDVFVAIKGEKFDGHDFINDALSKGAKYVVCQDSNIEDQRIIKTQNTRRSFSLLSSYFYKDQPENIVAVTGTNGKSSTVWFYKQIIDYLGSQAVTIGTMGVAGIKGECNLTTPDAKSFFSILKDCYDQNIKYVAFEASSHGLYQHRVDGVKIKAAGFTNFTQDHMDFHKTLDHYFSSKIYLFTDILQSGFAVINTDIPEYDRIFSICKAKGHQIITYGRKESDIRLLETHLLSTETRVILSIENVQYDIKLGLIGDFQIYNLICAIGLVRACGFSYAQILSVLSQILPVEGRIQKVNDVRRNIYIDYAHTPDALEKALSAIRPYVNNRLLCLFGCGGNRDSSKRKLMGEVAEKNSDITIITDDNPRHEDPKLIRKQILEGCPNAYEIEGREVAIKEAIRLMQEGDILLIAGKGHENYQIIGDKKLDFSDYEIAQRYAKL